MLAKAVISLKATHTQANSLKGYLSETFGFTKANGEGKTSKGLWWSVIITSNHNFFAYSTSSTAVIPLSTVITNETFFSFNSSKWKPLIQ